MLAFSLGKLLLLAFIILIFWYGFKFVGRVGQVREAIKRASEQAAAQQPQSRNPKTIVAEDLVKCRACGAYVPAKSASSCGRADCPWGR